MLSPRRGLLSPCPIGELLPHVEKEGESEAPATEKGKKERKPAVQESEKEASLTGHIGRDISSRESCGLAKSSQESDKPTTKKAHPPHYAHRSCDFNVPLEMAACHSTEEYILSVLRAQYR